MLQSKLLGETFKEWPSEATLKSHGLLIKGGYIRQMAGGIYTMLPLAKKVNDKIQCIIREEMEKVGAQEILMPVVATRKLWELSDRYQSIGSELLRFQDRNGVDMVLSMTHEEACVMMAMTEGKSYQKYPFSVYQMQTKFRDEARPRGGLIRVREFTMKDAYSFHTTQESLDETYEQFFEAYHRIFKRVGIPEVVAVASDTGMMGGSGAHEYMLLCDAGEDKIVVCTECRYSANMEVAYTKEIQKTTLEEEPLEKIYTPNIKTIDALADFVHKDKSQLLKVVIYTRLDTKETIIVCIRGDREVNETKLRNLLHIDDENLTTKKEEEGDSIVYGFVGPKNLHSDHTIVVYDISLKGEKSLVTGANEKDYHYVGFSMERDLGEVDYVDVSKVANSDCCPICGKKALTISNGVEVGNIFKLGDKYTKTMGMKYVDENGKEQYPIMGCYGIGVGRLMASVLEARATQKAMNWPITIAPFDIHICPIDYTKSEEVKALADELYQTYQAQSLDVLLDDRAKTPGVKFADADLIGAPVRLVVSPRNLANHQVEVKIVGEENATLVMLEELEDYIKQKREALLKEVE